MDRTWYSWQIRDPSKRKEDFSGNLVYEDYDNKVAGNATLDTLLSVGALANGQSIKVRDVMDTRSGPFCYIYDKAY